MFSRPSTRPRYGYKPTTIKELYDSYGEQVESRARHYMKRHPEMSEAEAVEAAICWAINLAQQAERRQSHGTGHH